MNKFLKIEKKYRMFHIKKINKIYVFLYHFFIHEDK